MFYRDGTKFLFCLVIAVAACGLTHVGAMEDRKGSAAERGGGRVLGSTGRADRRAAARRSEMAVDGGDLAGVHMPELEGMRIRREFIERLNELLPIMSRRVDGFEEQVRQLAVDYSLALQIKQRQENAVMEVDVVANGEQDAISACAQFELSVCCLLMAVVRALCAFSEELRMELPLETSGAAEATIFERLHGRMSEEGCACLQEMLRLLLEFLKMQIDVQTEAVLRKNDEEAGLDKEVMLVSVRRKLEEKGMLEGEVERMLASIGEEFDCKLRELQAMNYERRLKACHDSYAAMVSRTNEVDLTVRTQLSSSGNPISTRCHEFLGNLTQACRTVMDLFEPRVARLRGRLPVGAERLAQELADLVGAFGRLGVDADQPSGSGQ